MVDSAELEKQRDWIRSSSPIQGYDSVDTYYVKFCNWKEKWIRLNYQATEEDYVEDFIKWLQFDIYLRVYDYRSKLCTMSDALAIAFFDETMLLCEEEWGKTNLEIEENKQLDGKDLKEDCDIEEPYPVYGESVFGEQLESKVTVENDVGSMLEEMPKHPSRDEFDHLQGDKSLKDVCIKARVEKDVMENEKCNMFEKRPHPILADDINANVDVEASDEEFFVDPNHKSETNETKGSEPPNTESFAEWEAQFFLRYYC